jgi:hypothetical protein
VGEIVVMVLFVDVVVTAVSGEITVSPFGSVYVTTL